MSDDQTKAEARARAARKAGLIIAGSGVFWILAIWIGGALGLSTRLRALFDLVALAGFGFGLWMTYQAWRIGQ